MLFLTCSLVKDHYVIMVAFYLGVSILLQHVPAYFYARSA